MEAQIRIKAEHVVDGKVIESTLVIEHGIEQIINIADLGFNHKAQINILKGCQESLLKVQSSSLKEELSSCPQCGAKMKCAGSIASYFHSVFTDHKVPVKRQKCCNKNCGWTNVPSISSLFNTNLHPDLAKLQTEMGCNHTYREAEKQMNLLSYYPRKINNHARIHTVVEVVGNYISEHQIEKPSDDIKSIPELICQVDGGHLKSKQAEQRSFEALTSVIYSPKNIHYSDKSPTTVNVKELPRGTITSKHCAASALADDLKTIKRQTLVAALKQGMTAETQITALCDGASNCWKVIDRLEGECHSIVRILDWFHIAKHFQQISLPKYLAKRLDKTKWCLWHGRHEESVELLNGIINNTRSQKMKDRLTNLQTYLKNNSDYLTDYAERYKQGKVISSSVAESTVENLINKRCKGKQHMKWTRKGIHPLLQVRASAASNDWKIFGDYYVFNAITQKAA